MSETTYVKAPLLADYITRAMMVAGLPEDDAKEVGSLMAEADLIGADAHGIFRLPQYIRRLRAGGYNPTPKIEVKQTGPATALVDGDNGMGHLVMARATRKAIELARETGVAWVGAHHSNHAGPASLYAAMPIEHGMVGIYSAVASANHMAPWGGIEMLLGTNPLAIGVPAGEEPPILLDIATTVVSYGTVKNYALQGKTMPEGWMVERATGLPLTDPKRTSEGMLLPIGGYKGAGLALVLGLLAGSLNGAAMGRDVVDFNADDETETNTGHFIIVLDVARFVDRATFGAEVDRHLRDLRASPAMPGNAIRMPGEERAKRRAARDRDGVPIGAPLRAALDKVGEQLGIGKLP